jgi:hypothetical protein
MLFIGSFQNRVSARINMHFHAFEMIIDVFDFVQATDYLGNFPTTHRKHKKTSTLIYYTYKFSAVFIFNNKTTVRFH